MKTMAISKGTSSMNLSQRKIHPLLMWSLHLLLGKNIISLWLLRLTDKTALDSHLSLLPVRKFQVYMWNLVFRLQILRQWMWRHAHDLDCMGIVGKGCKNGIGFLWSKDAYYDLNLPLREMEAIILLCNCLSSSWKCHRCGGAESNRGQHKLDVATCQRWVKIHPKIWKQWPRGGRCNRFLRVQCYL